MKLIDLSPCLGGSHVALRRLGHECVFASEIDPVLQATYELNCGLKCQGDIRPIAISAIPAHDILCAGFPCQPFSKASRQEGLDCPRFGTLFDNVINILHARTPEFVILENVPNLARHQGGNTWERMRARLETAGYTVDQHRLSPHQFGVPQVR